MDRSAHFEAVKALVTPAPTVHDTTLPVGPDGKVLHESYAVMYDIGPDDPPDDERFTSPQTPHSAVTLRYVLRSVGVTPFAAREVAKAVSVKLIGARPVVAGRTCRPIRLDESGELKVADDVSPPLYFIDADYLLRSEPA